MRLNQAINKYFTSEWLHAMMANDIDYVTEAFNQFKKHKKLNILKQINDIHLTQRYIFASDGSVHGGGHNATEIISLLFIKNGKITHEIIRKEKSILLHGSTPILAACDINMTFTSDKKRIDGNTIFNSAAFHSNSIIIGNGGRTTGDGQIVLAAGFNNQILFDPYGDVWYQERLIGNDEELFKALQEILLGICNYKKNK